MSGGTEKSGGAGDVAAGSVASFSSEEIAQWLEWLASRVSSVSPQMGAVIQNIRRDVDHPRDGIAGYIQHNAKTLP
jgi:hypothetical protein